MSSELVHHIGGDSLDWDKIWSSIINKSISSISTGLTSLKGETFLSVISNLHPVLRWSCRLIYAYSMYWKCKDVKLFWGEGYAVLSIVLDVTVPCSPTVLLLNDTTPLTLTYWKRRMLLSGITAAKKMQLLNPI